MADVVRKNIEKISLEVGEKTFNFTIGREDYNKYLNTITPSNKVAPHHNLLMSTVDADCRDDLRDLLNAAPGAEMEIASELINAYTPDLNIVVKKSSSAQSN